MAHAHNRVTADEQAALDQHVQEMGEFIAKVVKASLTPEAIARYGFRYTGWDGKARRWKLEVQTGERTVSCEGTMLFSLTTYIGSTRAKENPNG